ncbi:MAG: hypothetical protein ACSW8K_11690 [bacterium]
MKKHDSCSTFSKAEGIPFFFEAEGTKIGNILWNKGMGRKGPFLYTVTCKPQGLHETNQKCSSGAAGFERNRNSKKEKRNGKLITG